MEYHWKLIDWLAVPVILFGGILVGLIVPSLDFFGSVGTYGCVIGSFVLAYLAYLQPKKDIVALLTPLYAIIIFANPDFNREPFIQTLIQVLYAASLTVLVIRLKWRFSSDGKGDESPSRYDNEGENDEDLPDQVPPEYQE